jgi:hypothetical protein
MPPRLDRDTQEYLEETQRSLEKVPIQIFLCGSGISPVKRNAKKKSAADIRLIMREKLKREFPRCAVKLGEHKPLIRAFKKVVGKSANLADHEVNLAKRKKMDLVVIFPSSPGSFAELGMFSLADPIAKKLIVFVNKKYKNKGSFLVEGPVKAAKLRTAQVHYVDYRHKTRIWNSLREIVIETKNRKRSRKALI